MVVGFLINTSEPFYRGGYERRAWSLARELVRQGHEVRIYTSCPRDEVIDGVQFVRLAPARNFFNAQGVRNGSADLLFALNILRLLGKLRSRELDVLDVCATPFIHLPIAALVARVKRIPLVLTCHEALLASLPDYVEERGHRGVFIAKMLAALLAGIYRLGMRMSSWRLAVSPRTARALAAEGFPARATVEFGLEAAAFAPSAPAKMTDPARFVFCGRLTKIKAVELTLSALLALGKQGEEFHFDIAGDGSELGKLKEIVAKAGASDRVIFHGEISEDAKRQLFAGSEIFVLSSPREGFSIATLEAMAQGCGAVVVSDPATPNGALDFVRDGDNGLVVGPGAEAMHRGLQTLMHDPALRLRLRQSAWETAKNYRVDQQAARLAAFYQSVKDASSTTP